jgi:long-chain acyl-CoA synthetase
MDSERVWFGCYPAGVEPEARPFPCENLGQLVHQAAERFGDRKAETLVLPNGMEASLSFKQVDRLSEAFASYLIHGLQLRAGTRVAILLPNTLAYPICAFGTLKAGCVVVNINPLYTPRELELQLQDSGAEVLVALDNFGDRVGSVVPRTRLKTIVMTSIADFFPLLARTVIQAKLKLSGLVPPLGQPFTRLPEALKQGAAYLAKGHGLQDAQDHSNPTRESLALLQYTGGTTGTSKGAMLSHGNLLANLEQIAEITQVYLTYGEETVLTVLPMYHVIAFTINLLFGFHSGSHSILVPNPRPLKNLQPALEKHEITWATAVNTLLKALPEESWFEPRMTRKLLGVFAGGMKTHPSVLQNWEAITGCLVIEGFGLSEASPLVTFNAAVRSGGRLRRTMKQVGGVGLPLPGTDIRIIHDGGTALPAGEHGEILVRGPQVMQGYWNQPEETARTLRDGWLFTGDIGCFDAEGYLEISDRKKDMIIVSGFNVFPNEVEACIALHPEVADVAVVGVPSEVTGEAVRAFIVARSELTVEEIRAHCRNLLVNYKIPTSIQFLAEIPKNAVGKALRRELRSTTSAQG